MSQVPSDRQWHDFEVLFGRRLKMYRLAAGLTQPQLIEKMEPFGTVFDVAALSKVENGKARAAVSMRDVCAAAAALGIPAYELVLDDAAAQLVRTFDKGGVPAVQRWCADEVGRLLAAPSHHAL